MVIREFLDPFDPVVSNSHAHSEIEAYATLFKRSRQTCHTTDILSNREGLRVHFMNQHVRKRQICDCIVINTLIEIVLITNESLLKTMVPIQHAGHAIKAESVYMIFLHPELAV